MLDHDKYDKLASLSAIGELSPEEQQEFLCHKETCKKCREMAMEVASIAASAFLLGGASDEGPAMENERYRRAREAVARRISLAVPARQKRWIMPAATAGAFALGVGLGVVMAGHAMRVGSSQKRPVNSAAADVVERPAAPPLAECRAVHFQSLAAALQKRIDATRRENHEMGEKLTASGQHAAAMESQASVVGQQLTVETEDVNQTRNDLSATRAELSEAQELVSSYRSTIESLQYSLANREARLTEVSARLDRERGMLSADREIRNIMGARDLHIVDVTDRDAKGRREKAFGRLFYTQGKSLICYAFDLSPKNTDDGRFVYAAWGSNSNELGSHAARRLGIFYNDDETQHRWSMEVDDPKILEEIDTVFVTLEPAGHPFKAPTGKAILEAYFGTPPNHP